MSRSQQLNVLNQQPWGLNISQDYTYGDEMGPV